MKDKIGLIGLGLVGTAIAEHLLAGDFDVIGFDIDSTRCQHLKDLGGNVDGNPAQLAQQVDRIILSLPDTNIVCQVVEGPAGILEAKTTAKYIIDTTTGDPDETVALAQRLAKRQIYLLDSTIAGSSRQVRDKEVVFMIGGDKAAFETCSDIFQTLSEKIFYLGPSGSGSKAKIASNLILGLNRIALAEGLVFANKLGLEPETFLEMLKSTPAYSAVMDVKGEKMLNGDFTAESRIRQHHKDVSLILKYAEIGGQELPLSQVHFDALEKAIEAGDGDLDNAAIIREIERRTKD
ncbi:MAG: NAD-binding protein [Phycisphaerae bacterium]|nr:NAD(P)-dependent oxidoreductase [Phycisphaerae bacterium]NIS52148.1 NAD(P)-dependent oxidoreductase [Phycisphaerae bacterium]NIU09683.1 NAD(P)-dependent oxidoreductase [Phycisphaerae bacterium]NIU57378.1 NAD-binding protein [Phycisphaerae bacterium]NIV01646.1 NAD-binding protein [Phycisphaerae bacterium]